MFAVVFVVVVVVVVGPHSSCTCLRGLITDLCAGKFQGERVANCFGFVYNLLSSYFVCALELSRFGPGEPFLRSMVCLSKYICRKIPMSISKCSGLVDTL